MGGQRLHNRRHAVGLGLLCEHTLRVVSVAFALSVLFVCVLHRDLFVHHELAVHVGDGIVRGVKVGIRHESISL